MKTKHTLPFILALGMTAGSTAAYAQSLDLSADTDLSADVQTGATSSIVGSATSTTTELCADGETCLEDSASGDMTTATETDITADADTSLVPMGDTDADADASIAAGDDGLMSDGELTTVASLASSDALVGARAYDSNDEWIGEVSAVIPVDASAVGDEEQFVIDVGGFLGIGEKPVAVAASELRVSVDAEGEVEHVVVSHTMAELEAMPEVEM